MRTRTLLGACALLLFGLSAPRASAQSQATKQPTQPARQRRIARVRWDTLWTTTRDTVAPELLYPVAIAADQRNVFVVDGASGQIRKYDLRTGKPLADVGGSQTRVRQARRVQVANDGTLLTFAPDLQEVQVVSLRGGVINQLRAPEQGIRSACETDDGSILALSGGDDAIIYRLGAVGFIPTSPFAPWPEFNTVPPIARQAELSPIPGHNACVLAHTLGGGLAIVSPSRVLARTRYVDDRSFPEAHVTVDTLPRGTRRTEWLVKKTATVVDVSADSVFIDVAYDEPSAPHGLWLDRYDAGTGAYVESFSLPFRPNRIIKTSRGYVTVVMEQGKFQLIALGARRRSS